MNVVKSNYTLNGQGGDTRPLSAEDSKQNVPSASYPKQEGYIYGSKSIFQIKLWGLHCIQQC